MTVTELWASAWADAVAEQQQRSDIHIDKWRTAGQKTKDKPHGEDLAYWQAAGLEQVEAYKTWLKSTGWKLMTYEGRPLAEFALFGTFNNGLNPVKGFVDAVFDTGSGLIIVDYKTGSRPPHGPQQLALYATMMKKMGMPVPTLGAYYMTRKCSLGPIEELGRWDERFFDRIFKQLHTAKHMNVYLPNVQDHCGYCAVSQYCYAAGGSESAGYDPDDPNCIRPEF